MSEIMVPVAPGELLDKISILRLKTERISDPDKLANVRREYDMLCGIAAEAVAPSTALTELMDRLYAVNADLWVIEDDIRACDARGDFGVGFIALARAVYDTNDTRAAIKREINVLLGSPIIEEKSYRNGASGA